MSQDQRTSPLLAGIYYTDPEQKERVDLLSISLELPVITDCSGYDLVLSFVGGRLCLSMPNDPLLKGQVCAEFVKGPAGYRRKHGRKELLLKAIGFHKEHPPRVLDATGGMGKDSFLMASHGCIVHVCERNRIVAALLQDGINRAAGHPDTHDIAGKIRLSPMDSQHFLNNLPSAAPKYDVIYLDPMYPERSKSSLVKKEMQVLQKLIGQENDTERIFTTAMKKAGKRVVVKRPKTALPLANSTPSHTISGKTTRYDVYLIR